MERWENDVRCQGQKVCGQVPVHLQARELPGEARERLLKARRGAPGDLSLRGRSPWRMTTWAWAKAFPVMACLSALRRQK